MPPLTRRAAKRPHRESNPPEYDNSQPRIDQGDQPPQEGGMVAPQCRQQDLDIDDTTVRMDTMDVGGSKSEQDVHIPSSPLTELNGECTNFELP